MTETRKKDEFYMKMALDLAKNGTQSVSPNPMVGCVIVKDGEIIGEGRHERCGEAHAEVNAVKNARQSIEGSSVYVTLEPCSHFGKTPPCAKFLAEMKPKEVIIGTKDPNPKVNGEGMKILREAGIEVRMSELEEECKHLNRGFLRRIKHNRPWITVKIGMSLDGKVALKNGAGKWITGDESRKQVHKMRAGNDAVLTGVGTILADDPKLDVRLVEGNAPRKVILDSFLRTPLDAKIFDGNGCIFFADPSADGERISKFEAKGAEVLKIRTKSDKQIAEIMAKLAEKGINYLMVEAGAKVASSFIKSGLADEFVLFIAPKFLGGKNGLDCAEYLNTENLNNAIKLRDIRVEKFGEDICVKGAPECSPDL